MSDDQYTDRPIADSDEDEFGFEDYRTSLVRVIQDAGTPITIGIFGTWGSGKTSLMRIVEKDLQEKYYAKTVWFDAWKYDKENVLWRALLVSVLDALRPRPPEEGKELSEEDKKLDKKLDDLQDSLYRDVDREEAGSVEIDWHEAAKGTIKLGLSFLPLQSVLQGPLKHLEGTGAPKDAVGHLVDTFRRERIKIHRDRVQFLDQFQQKFSTLVTDQIREDGRLVVFIDNLDRCLPEKAVEILEAIKLFLEVERCVFVVGVEQRIIQQGIRVKYRDLELADEGGKKVLPISGNEYLEKIVQIPFYLPALEQKHIADFAHKRLAEKFERPVAEVFAQGIEANPRKIKRVLNIFRLLWTLAEERGMAKEGKQEEEGKIEADLLAKIVVIQSRWRDLYADVIKYPNLLGNLEDRFERMAQEAEAPPQPPPEQRDTLPDEAATSSVEDTAPNRPEHSPQKTLVEKYAGRESLKELLLTPGASLFKGKELNPYIYLTATVIEKRDEEDREVSVDARIWEDLTSNDPTRIEAAAKRIEDRQKEGYVKRLVAILSDQRTNDLNTRIAAGNALGMLGDPRLDAREMEMIPIPEGTFTMGTDGKERESPQHKVHLDAFEIAKYPLTNVQYKAFLDAKPKYAAPEGWSNRNFPAGKANHPVVDISWEDAQAYAAWLTKETGKRYRLPTEAEWEKGARGTDAREYPWEGKFDPAKCNTREGGPGDTTSVGIYPEGASPYGVMDMAGNVWEWCADWYDPDYYEKGENRNPKGPKKGNQRVVRGGSWYDLRVDARCAFRGGPIPDLWYGDVGVRLSRSP